MTSLTVIVRRMLSRLVGICSPILAVVRFGPGLLYFQSP